MDDGRHRIEEDRAPASHAEQRDEPKRDEEKKPAETPNPLRRRLLIGGGILAALLLAVGGGWWWWSSRQWESTDDAFIEAHVTRLAPQVGGRIARLLVQDNQRVEAGQLLVEIDPRDLDIALATARARQGSAAAQVAQAEAELAVRRASIGQADANVLVAEADLENAETSLRRFRSVDPRAVTQQQRDDAESGSRGARARLEAMRQAAAAARAQATSAEARIRAAEAAKHEADAAVANAELQRSYAGLTAPVAGRVTNRSVEVGNMVTAGQALLALVEPEVWVTANFKETQLRTIREGQTVEVKVDAYSDPVLRGRVDSIQRGTGARFSVLPAQNATGNYVKVTQRVPVKIVLADDRARNMPLSPGLSVVPRVRVRGE
ncbi:HlyD family secretion protein [Belnapia sp. T6]|uniref:HlyD family secretion protein n=1 Tax=Belnapia mucosa TaxID=2804532 RepID=A0ABS1V5N5_9PROT|nr:HlyD family secretion protein [Belnapia mucosa]MBL6456004.1 HlyD family secretion protein [Belnapia mucosa]